MKLYLDLLKGVTCGKTVKINSDELINEKQNSN